MTDNRIVFIDENGIEHNRGTIVEIYYEGREKFYEPLLERLNDVGALLQLAQNTYGTWRIEQGLLKPNKEVY